MDVSQRRLVGVAMDARSRQWVVRSGIGLIIALSFFTMTGALFATGWLAFYCLLQLIEVRVFKRRPRTLDGAPGEVWCWAAVAFIAFNNFVFGAFAVRQAVGGAEHGLVGAALLIAGAIVNGVIVSAGSRHLTWASIGPQILCFIALALSMVSAGESGLLALQIGGASLLFVVAAIVASSQLEVKLRETEDGRRLAEAASVAKSQFLANMSHEIRTPLNGVVSMAELLSRSDLPAADREMVEIIRSSGDTLTSLLSDILDMSRIEAGEITLEQQPYPLGDVLRATCALFSLRAQEKNVRLILDLPREVDRMVTGDGGRVRQVLNNLVSNAVKFTSAGTVTVSAACVGEDRVRLTVSDTGIGFDTEGGVDVFGRFQQADGTITRRFGGSGLGLAISRDLVGLMGGSLECSSVPGLGSRFSVELPFLRADQPVAEGQASVSDAEAVQASVRVLVADDHPTNLKVVGLILEQVGVEVVAVEDGAQAVAAFSASVFDVVLMDMQMPVMDGLTAIGHIRRIEAAAGQARTPIAVLSANAMAEHVAAALEAGADTHISKPFKPALLLETVERMLATTDVAEAFDSAA